MAIEIEGQITEGHLGGYVPGGDPATQYPDLWRWLVERLGVRSVIDIGCGDGQAVDYFQALGVNAVGVEGIEQNHPAIFTHDYANGPWLPAIHDEPSDRFDLAWSCEFVEHVEARFIPNFMETFRCANRALITHAEPGQPGWHHVNCQSADYWIETFDAHGFDHDPGLTETTRELARMNESPWNHYGRSGLAFYRRP